ncbi:MULTISPECIES: group I truncated hemoglobin [Idiomarina]|jgi:hemoglobin|uniref:Group 1 truncated hemoglobin n=2 Tax=Idiomarina baltica TaxID=190892 RepID=A0A348WMG9_9GAMM|nr:MULTISPECIES: group 1 truncated hemoglobin [Idiomarina]EAQ30896.1 Cyanoglobin family protein [Idiomarina baltica OS145]KXS36015.1 MAG: cyanoglobin family protein [Idiomarina sp. T82-3]MBL74447.1 group 1 truncated hemoglobin [Idiomarinaceae bacterium]HAR55731.1 group 1 truncated hemoglobin [Idiomarina baltica]|tara:strand:- start:560 stop:982 length:423 start_codon:yes stop_codon:yes gene_type:complete
MKIWVSAALVLLGSMMSGAVQAQSSELYQQLGERSGIETIVEEMLLGVADDERIAHYFADVDILRLHKLISEQVCNVSGGPCEYTGDSMAVSHNNLGINNADFNALVEHLIAAMEQENVPVAAQNELLALLAPMHQDIVE